MITIANLMTGAALPQAGPLAASKLWLRSLSTLTQLDLHAFLVSHRGLPSHKEAMREVNALCDAGIRAAMQGIIPDRDAFYFQTGDSRAMTAGDLSSWLAETTPARAAAILFALESGYPLKETVSLTWRNARHKLHKLPELACEIVTTRARHLKLDYVFWEFSPAGAAAPLYGLEETALEVSQGRGFDELRALYRDMPMIDTDQSAVEVAGHFARVERELLGG